MPYPTGAYSKDFTNGWTADKLLKGAGAGADPTPIDPPGAQIFGDGSDGDVTVTASYSGGPITNNALTRDAFFNNLTIESGAALDTAGYRLFVKGNLINNGTIKRNGKDSTTIAGGAALTNGSLGGSGAGGDGGIMDAVGNPGESVTDALGSSGGNGGAGIAAGGSGGTATAPAAAEGGYRALPLAILLRTTTGIPFKGGAGGGGGGGGSSYDGGGGGSGGGVLLIVARVIDNSSGIIQANGGKGANGLTNNGSGGGGGGGCVILVYESLAVGTEQASGGAGGTGGGGNGSPGSDGTVIKIHA